MSNRIQQLNQTILELRIRGLQERAEIRALRHINKGQKNALEAAQAQIEQLKRQHSDTRMMVNADVTGTALAAVTCMDARQYESLSLKRAGSEL